MHRQGSILSLSLVHMKPWTNVFFTICVMEIEIESFLVNQSIEVLLQSNCQKMFEALFPILPFKMNIPEKL